MKNLKKLAAVFACLAAAFCLSVQAFAATTGSITVKNAVNGQDYKLYRVFDLESFSQNSYSYKVNSDWKDFLEKDDVKDKFVTVDAAGYVTWKENASEVTFAELARKYVTEKSLTPVKTETAAGDTVTFSDLELGYYLVDSSLGLLCGLTTTNPNAELEEKNTQPTITKQVQENSTNLWGATNDAKIGETVSYKSIITIGKGTENLTMHDVMEPGLTFTTGSVTITDTKNAVKTTDYTVNANTADQCTFEVSFKDEYVLSLAVGDQITVEYKAVLNDKAEIHNATNDNEVWLSFGDKNTTTEKSKTETSTYKFDLVKTDEDGKIMKGAEFTLYESETGGTALKLVAVSEDDTTGIYKYRLATDEEIQANTNITETIKAGKATVEGLDSSKYYLQEDKQPEGYNKLTSRHEVDMTGKENKVNENTVNNDGSIYGELAKDQGGEQIINKAGLVLPSTGGMGTTLIYGAGGLLAAGAAVIFLAEKRMKK